MSPCTATEGTGDGTSPVSATMHSTRALEAPKRLSGERDQTAFRSLGKKAKKQPVGLKP